MFTHVHTMRHGKMTGEFRGYVTEELAKEYVDQMRNARDNSPSYIHFKTGGYDWNILDFGPEGEDYENIKVLY